MKKLKEIIKKIPFNDKLLYALFIIPFLGFFYRVWRLDNDAWFLFNHGRYVLENGFPYIEPFTMHEGLKFVMQQWLSAVLLYVPFNLFGKFGVLGLLLVVYSLIILISYKLCMLISDNNKQVSIVISVIMSTLMSYAGYIVSRPQTFTFLVILIFLYFIEKYMKSGNNKYLIALPIISIIEINLHASTWWMLIIAFIPFLIDAFYNKKVLKSKVPYRFDLLVIAFTIVFFAGLINPYGVDAITYLFYGTNARVSESIVEMLPARITEFKVLIIFAFLMVNIIAYMKNYKKTNKIKLSYLFLLIGYLMISVQTRKGVVYSYIFSIYPLAYYFKDFKLKNSKLTKKSKTIYGILIALLAGYLSYSVYVNISYGLSETMIIEQPVNYLLENYSKEDMRVLSIYDHGGYLEYKGIKTYIDPRAEVFLESMNKKADIYSEYYKVRHGYIDINTFVEKYKFTHIMIVQSGDFPYIQQLNDNYELVYNNNVKIYARKLDV